MRVGQTRCGIEGVGVGQGATSQRVDGMAFNKVRSKRMSISIMPFLLMLYWSCHWRGRMHSTWLPSSAFVNRMFSGLVLAFGLGLL